MLTAWKLRSFQAIKHRCADMLVDVEGMRSSTWYAAWAISAGEPDDVGGGVDGQGVVFGRRQAGDGVGAAGARRYRVHLEHDLHLFMKRSQFDRLDYGDAVYHRERLAGLCGPAS